MNVLWLNFDPKAPNNGYWCTVWLEEIFEPYTNLHSPDRLSPSEGAIVVIPAEYNAPYVAEINEVLTRMPWAVVILASDERGLFPVEDLTSVTALWVMTPHFEEHNFPAGTNFMGEFYTGNTRHALEAVGVRDRKYKSGFSGQITHQRRHELAEVLNRQIPGHYFNATDGFAKGLDRFDYFTLLAESVTVPAPSGPVTLDSFRAFEALEAGAMPILDLNCPKVQNGNRYWTAVFGAGHPLPMVSHWSEAFEFIDNTDQEDLNRVYAWWQGYKRDIRNRILADVPSFDHGPITALVPTSPIASHPSTEIIEETIASIRHNLPDAEILIMIDGVRAEQEHYRERYTEYIRNLLWLCNFRWDNVVPVLFEEHHHQASMTRETLKLVNTPNILFVEHDAPLVTDRPFDWDEMCALIDGNILDMIRFHYAGHIHPDHEYLMTDPIPVNLDGVWLRRTVQWSQRPHLASTRYYRHILEQYFAADSVTMIEDRMHSMARSYPEVNRLAVYCPKDDDGTIIRSYHLDGRLNSDKTDYDPKYDMHFGSVTE